MADSHADGAVDKQGSTARLVDEEENDRGEDDEQRVLDAGRHQIGIASEAGHEEDIDDIVDDNIGLARV